MKRIFTPVAITFLALATSFAQVIEKKEVDRYGNPTFVKFDTKFKSAGETDSKAVLSKVLNTAQNDKYKTFRTEQDKIGYTHERFQQYYKGIKVEHGVYIVHKRKGTIESLSGEYKAIDNINVSPSISSDAALKKALEFVNAEKYMWETDASYLPEAELVVVKKDYNIHPKEANEMALAYKFNIYATHPLSRSYIYVDAQTGEIVHTNAIIKTAEVSGSADTRYSGTKTISTDSYNGSYRLRDYSRGNGIITYDCNTSTSYTSAVDFTDNDNNWTSAEYNNYAKDNGALDAHWAGLMTYDYFNTVHGRNSFDGNGALIKTYVHFDNNYENAYWNGSVFTFGDGASTFDILTSLDVFGHEFGHAVCSYTCDLTYSREPGALNEAFSDIWGCAIEYKYAPNKDTWFMGEDLGYVLRDLSNPKAKGLPDTYLGSNWVTSSSDYYGVHTNNGPFCYWFYLLSVGGSGSNDNNDSYTVTGIGIEKAEQIAFRVENVYMTSSSDYADARTFAIQAAKDLYGAGSQEEISVTNAMYAIGVGNAYDGGTSGDTYCESKGSNYSYEWISGVTIGSFTNNSGANAYTDNTSQTITLNSGSTNSVSLVPGFSSSTYNEYWKIWIDLNGDSDFDDSGELVFDAGSLSSSTVTGNLVVPNVSAINTRLRVSMKYNGAQTACETFSYGEVEDYTVNIISGAGDTQAPSAPTGLSSSDITETSFTLSWNASSDNVGVVGYDVYQGGSNLGSVTGTSASITGLTAATTYTFYVRAKDAAGNVSSNSSSLDVTTSGGSGGGCTDITLSINFDNYPEETSWTIKDNSGTTVASGGTYGSQPDGSTLTETICLEDGCYDFTIKDSYGDGICCSYGNGSYSLMNGSQVIASGGNFGSSEITNFCLTGGTLNSIHQIMTSIEITQKDVKFEIFPNPVNELLNIQAKGLNESATIKIVDMRGAKLIEINGAIALNGIDVSSLESGMYILQLKTKKGKLQQELFIKN